MTTDVDGQRADGSDHGHRLMPHTADVIVEAWAPSRAGCLEELLRGVVETFADTGGARATREIPIDVDAASGEEAVVAVIEEVCLLLDAEGLVVVDAAVSDAGARVRGTLFVAPVDVVVPTGAAPKGVSRSDLRLEFDGTRWAARAIVDV
jgi:SHS2 domain-containing protein